MAHFLFLLYHAVESPQFLIAVIGISLFIKIYFLTILITQGFKVATIHKPWIFLFGTIAGSIFGDIAWAIKLTREIFTPELSYIVVTFFIRIAWAFLIVQYQSLSFFAQSLAEKRFQFRRIHTVQIIVSSLLSLYFFYIAFFNPSTLVDEYERETAKTLGNTPPIEIAVMRYVVFYLLGLITLPGLYLTIKKIRSSVLPKILRKQLKICFRYLLCPYLLVEFLQAGCFNFKFMQANLYPIVSLSTLLLSYMIYHTMQKIMGLRFLNFSNHVQDKPHGNIIDDFKTVLEQLSHTTSVQELHHITQTFFKEAFAIPLRNTRLHIRKNLASAPVVSSPEETIESLVEQFMNSHPKDICECIKRSQLLNYDEIAFSHFYEETGTWQTILTFLQSINADIFIPIYVQQKMIAYIIITMNTRPHECYTINERDSMLVFSSYLGNIINLLQNKNIEALIHHEKELQEEVYSQHQEISQYKESIKSFLQHTKQKMIGIIFYKNRHFTLNNQAAKELIGINPNIQEGHPLTKALKQVAHRVQTYKSAHITLAQNNKGNSIVLSGVPNLEKNNVLITASYPELSDIITTRLECLYDPNTWNYLLYLQTTSAGKLITNLIPSSGEKLLNFKIALLKAALSKKALLLNMSDEDLMPMVELIHHISLRDTLHTLELTKPCTELDVAIQLFGMNPIFGNQQYEPPLLEKLNNTGTLFIKNIQFLDITSQKYLTEFIQYGFFRQVNSDHRLPSNVRIICSASKAPQDNHFSPELYQLLKKNRLSMPSLLTLPTEELYDLADRFAEQVLQTKTFKNFLTLTEKDKQRIALKRPASLQDFKTKVHQILIQKSKDNKIYNDTVFDPAYEVTDPELIEAARLGKYALKDQKIMTMLWHKFDKNQNKIATFLGVNRSSVNRRCKKYNLVLPEKDTYELS